MRLKRYTKYTCCSIGCQEMMALIISAAVPDHRLMRKKLLLNGERFDAIGSADDGFFGNV